ncbi:MAG: HEAT repeat domain-containing protein, partial [Thermoplasmata archaeon]
LLRDPHPWPRRGAVYALGALDLTETMPEIRERLRDDDPEVRLAAVWAAGRWADDGARPRLLALLRDARPRPAGSPPTFAQGEGAVRLASDADERLFGALVLALGSIAQRSGDEGIVGHLRELYGTLPDSALEQPVRSPAPLGPGGPAVPLRELFDRVLAGEDGGEDGAC